MEQSDGELEVKSPVHGWKVGFTDRTEGLTWRVTCFYFLLFFLQKIHAFKAKSGRAAPGAGVYTELTRHLLVCVCVCDYMRVLFEEGGEGVENVVRIRGVSKDTHTHTLPCYFLLCSLQANIH